MSQKGFSSIILILALPVVIISAGYYLFYRNNSTPQLNNSTSTSIQPTNTPEPLIAKNDLFDIDPLYGGDMLEICSKNLLEFPASASAALKTTPFVDLGGNKLTKLPITKDWQNIKELNLTRNSFSTDEQNKIKMQLPSTKIAFVPQNDFNPSVSDVWRTYSNPKYHFTFGYHPDLLISEEKNTIYIKNELNGFESAFASCTVFDYFFGISIAEKENPQNLTPIQYISKDFGEEVKLQGNPQSMIGPVKSYKNNQIDGVTFDAGESEHHLIYAAHKNYMYVFQIWPGGETGSSIGDLPKKTFYNILSTIKFE